MRKIDNSELRQIQLEILDDVHAFCAKKGLRYSLSGGSMLGAVRHKGYIPWDDDIDIMMPRPDYDRFIKEYKSEKNEVLDLSKRDTCVELFAKVSRKGSYMTDIVLGRTMWGVNIDIFPVETLPEEGIQRASEVMKMRDDLAVVCPYYKVVGSKKAIWFLKYLAKRITHPSLSSCAKLKGKISKLASRWDEDDAKAAALYGSYGVKEIVPAETFKNYTSIKFEGREVGSMKDYDTYLTALYGDYMTLPPKEKQVTHHLYDAYIE